MLTLYRFPFSTNVERVALALAHKRLEVESVWVDPADRGEVMLISGQELVPVLVDGDTVVADSTAILEHLEERFPERPLYPADPARRIELRLFIDWFNQV
ncbi:MAG: glutathione S-transferase N-terminal domain-containing protein, partial [Actinobacteria bacterium]|nr:glutathione S-transferase N-terminal domain-containing protein [Actinomycetota bacterium]